MPKRVSKFAVRQKMGRTKGFREGGKWGAENTNNVDPCRPWTRWCNDATALREHDDDDDDDDGAKR